MEIVVGPFRPADDGKLNGRMIRDIEVRVSADSNRAVSGRVLRVIRTMSGQMAVCPKTIPEV